MSEMLKNSGEKQTNDSSQWGEEYQNSVPPFNPEHNAQDLVNDSELVQSMLDDDNARQEELLGWIKGIKKGYGISYPVESREYNSDEAWVEDMEQELDDREKQQKILIEALSEQQNNEKYKNTAIEDILDIKSNELSDYIGKVVDRISEDERKKLVDRRNNIDNVRDRVVATRKNS